MNINNFVVKMENVCLYRKTGVGKNINLKKTKVGIDKNQKGINTDKEVFKSTIGLQ